MTPVASGSGIRVEPDLDLDRLLALLSQGRVTYLRLRIGGTQVEYSCEPASRGGAPPVAPAIPAAPAAEPGDRLGESTSNGQGPGARPAGTAGGTGLPQERGVAAVQGAEGPADGLVDVAAPMVGIFHHAPTPGAPPYVTAGQRVTPTTTIGLMESMKIFTTVPAGVGGIVVRVLVVSGQSVEKGQPLVQVRPETSGEG